MTTAMPGKNNPKGNKLFGTDGVRGTFGTYPLDEESILKLAAALAFHLKGARVVAGRDTRYSGSKILELLAAGTAGSLELFDAGVLPTPGLSFLTQRGGFDYGIMITASHNPWTDNGIKLFSGNGEKIPDALEAKLTGTFFQQPTPAHLPAPDIGKETGEQYIRFMLERASRLRALIAGRETGGLKLVVDCANGAAYLAAPRVFNFEACGCEAVMINHEPDGKNINLNCGSTHLEALARSVTEQGADLGIAFDGDGDRVLMVDGEGQTLDGDHTLYLIARYFKETEKEFNPVAVGTVLGNLGLEKALAQLGIEYVRTDVGDRHVYAEMKKRGALLGGEQSGHTIIRSCQKTGDGILTSLYFLEALFYFRLSPVDVRRELRLYPQDMVSLRVKEKPPLDTWEALNRLTAEFNDRHGQNSRVLVRYSGTEPKIRVMIESEDESVIHENMKHFEALIHSTIGN